MTHDRAVFVEQIMGMPVSVQVRGPAAEGSVVRGAVQALFAELRAVDERFSTYKPGSEISRIGGGTLALGDAAAEVREVAALCDEARRRTGGAFDAWLRDAAGRPRFDPTGLVKGWAVERAARHLAALDDHDFCLNAAGDVRVGCSSTDAPAWRVGIEDPVTADLIAAIVELRSGAVATSGTARRGAHIIDPASGAPALALRSVTVAGPSLTWADVYATAAFVRGEEAIPFLEGVEGYEGLVIDGDGGKRSTSGWAAPVGA